MEDIINQIDGQVQIIFEKADGDKTYKDALWFSQAEYDALTPEQISTMQQERFDNWLAIVNSLPTEEPIVETTPIE